MKRTNSANAIDEQIHNIPTVNLVNGEGGVLKNSSTLSHGTSHVCKDKWRTRANEKDLVIVRKPYQEIH